jgi:hypothetical protein
MNRHLATVAETAPTEFQQPHLPAKATNAEHTRMTVIGRVLDPDDNPLPGVPVDVIGRPREPWLATSVNVDRRALIGHGETDVSGQFRFDAARTASGRFFEVDAIAAMRGYGVGCSRLNPDADQPAAEIILQPEQVIHGRLVDLMGQPAAGVTICVGQVGQFKGATFDGVNLGESVPIEGLRAWPQSVKTDERGAFDLAGISRRTRAGLVVRDPRFAHQWLFIETDDQSGPKELTLVLQPATTIEGRVLAGDTGQAIPNATIGVRASREEFGGMYLTRFRAGGDGRFVANPSPGSYFRLAAAPPAGQPYAVTQIEFAWTKGSVRRSVDVRLQRGVLIRGKVTEEQTGRPLSGASVQFVPAQPTGGAVDRFQSNVASAADGSFQIAVPPGKGHLFVHGPTPDYILEMIGSRMLRRGEPGGERYYAHKIIPYDVRAGDHPTDVDVRLRRGETVKGCVVGPDGQTVEKAEIIAALDFNYSRLWWRGGSTIPARDGRFELHGLNPEKVIQVAFLDADHELGLAIDLSGTHAGQEMTIQLQPCGSARARFVGHDGKPVAGFDPFLEILVTPGPSFDTRDPQEQAMLAADVTSVRSVDRKHYTGDSRTDTDGRVMFPALIPGAMYRISDLSDRERRGILLRKEFAVMAGETVDLGEILIAKPES